MMLIGIRYHLSTLITLFLVLTLGILIGSVLEGEDTLIVEQKRLITRLERDFNILRSHNHQFKEEIAALKVELKENREFQDELLRILLRDRLKGEKLIINSITREEFPDFFKMLTYCGVLLEDELQQNAMAAGEAVFPADDTDVLQINLSSGVEKVKWEDNLITVPETVLKNPVEAVNFILMLEEKIKEGGD